MLKEKVKKKSITQNSLRDSQNKNVYNMRIYTKCGQESKNVVLLECVLPCVIINLIQTAIYLRCYI